MISHSGTDSSDDEFMTARVKNYSGKFLKNGKNERRKSPKFKHLKLDIRH